MRFPKGACPDPLPATAQIDAGEVLAGDPQSTIDVLVVSIGALAHRAVEAAEVVMDGDTALNVVGLDPVQSLPVADTLLELASAARAVVTVEDGVAERGIGAALAVRLAQQATVAAPAPALRTLGVAQKFIPHAKRDAILAVEGLDAQGITDSIESLLS